MRSTSSLFLLSTLASSLLLAAGCASASGTSSDGSEESASTSSASSKGDKDKCKIECKNGTDCLLDKHVQNLESFENDGGRHATYSTSGHEIDQGNAFFQTLGTNGRACVTCHTPEDAWSVNVAHLRERFEKSCGTDAIFRTNDGSNSPNADVSTLAAKRSAYSLLLNRGLIRLQIPVRPDAEFELVSANDPYGNSTANGISVFRRPLAATNLKFINLVMADGREPNLESQALNATLGHAQATTPPSSATIASIVAFEKSLFTSQTESKHAGSTSAHGAKGDPRTLSEQTFTPNGNPIVFTPPGVPPFNLPTFSAQAQNIRAFDIYDAWARTNAKHQADRGKQAVARGQELFNTRFFQLDTIPGLGPLQATCTTCHNAPNSGGNDQPVIESTVGVHALLTEVHSLQELVVLPDLPVYTFREKATGRIITSTDPGAALTTGKVADFGSFKSQVLRGLSGRAPYFHNGSAATLGDVVDFYDNRFTMGLSAGERSDLTAFLQSL